MRRGEAWWAQIPAPWGPRPVLLLSRDRALMVRTNVTVVLVTSTIRGIPTEVPLSPEDGMPKECVVNLDNILTIPKASLKERITILSADKMASVAGAAKFALDLE